MTAHPDAAPARVAGLPHHLLGRGPGRRWWRPPVVAVLAGSLWLVLVVALFGAAEAVAAAGVTPLAPAGSAQVFVDPVWDTALSLLTIAALLPAGALAVRVVERRPVGTLSSVAGRLRWGWLGRCAVLAVPLVVVQLAVFVALTVLDDGGTAELTGGPVYAAPRLLAAVAVVLVLAPLQSAAEEYLARGWIPQAVGLLVRSAWPGIVVGAVVFTALHLPSTWAGAADLVVFSVALGWLTWRTGGLEAAVVWHATSNTIVFLLAAAAGDLAVDGDAGGAAWPLLVADLLVLPVYALLVGRMHGRVGATAVAGTTAARTADADRRTGGHAALR